MKEASVPIQELELRSEEPSAPYMLFQITAAGVTSIKPYKNGQQYSHSYLNSWAHGQHFLI